MNLTAGQVDILMTQKRIILSVLKSDILTVVQDCHWFCSFKALTLHIIDFIYLKYIHSIRQIIVFTSLGTKISAYDKWDMNTKIQEIKLGNLKN